jgi:hypothetical protein
MHVVTPKGNGIVFWKTKLWELDEASMETDTWCESLIDINFIYYSVSIESDLCGTVGSPAGSRTASWYWQ